MKILFLLLMGFIFICLTNFKQTQNKYLPVYISLRDTNFSRPEVMLSLKASFGMRKIKILSKNDIETYINAETLSLGQDYKNGGGDINDWAKAKSYISSNMRTLGNSLTIDIRITGDGFINDTIRWDNHTIPINMQNFPKPKWHYMILDSTNAKTILQMSQNIVDSIIASNALIKE